MLTHSSKRGNLITVFLIVAISCTLSLAANRISKSGLEVTRNVNKYRPQNNRRDRGDRSRGGTNNHQRQDRNKNGISVNLRTNNIEFSFGQGGSSGRRFNRHNNNSYRPAYRNRYGQRFSRSSRSRYFVTYSSPGFSLRYAYPYHHRKYVFICLGGHWPVGYGHRRYFWYAHYPIVIYNYNYNALAALPAPQEEVAPPGQETLADRFFDDGVRAFEAGNFYLASDKFARAAELAPQDIVIPFAYAQALFADGKYNRSAEILRSAIMRISPQEQGIYFPRGLYNNESALSAQIDKLTEESEFCYRDSDLQLLLGYQLFGISEIDKSSMYLRRAAESPENAAAAGILLSLLEKYER